MANSSRDPYWQASVRRESIDHPQSQSFHRRRVFGLPYADHPLRSTPPRRYRQGIRPSPITTPKKGRSQAQDGVSCSVCHQIGKEGLGTRESFNGGFVIDRRNLENVHPEYGPFDIEKGNQTIMRTSNGRFPSDGRFTAYPETLNYARRVTSYIRKRSERMETSSASCPSRCPTSNGSTATIGTRKAARSVTCPW